METARNIEELHQLEHELHLEIVPGTEIMTDVGTHHFVKGNNKRVLVPQPSSDPHDPLNWSVWWKISACAASCFVSFTQGFAPLSLAPTFEDYIEAFNCTLEQAIQFSSVVIIILGFSNFIWVPLSSTIGRRPVLIFSQLICLASMVWRATATSYASFLGACCLNGIGSGPAETLPPQVIADIFFLHDRGKWNALYFSVYFGSLFVGPICSGTMAQHVGWRQFWWLNVAITGASVLNVIFMFPETKYVRVLDVVPGATNEGSRPSTNVTQGKPTAVEKEAPDTILEQSSQNGSNELEKVETAALDPWLGRGGPSRRQWGLYSPSPNPVKAVLLDVLTPWKLLLFPIVEFSAFVISWSCSCFLVVNLTQTQGFAYPPYNWSSQNIGFTNFALWIGSFIALATAGPLSDWISARATERNRGIREPEMRLPAMIPFVLIMILGNICVSVGFEHHWPWQAIVVIGFTCAGIQIIALPTIASTYAVDCYKPVAGSLFVAITVNKNLWSYGVSKFLTKWIVADGYIEPIMINCGMTTLWCLFGIVFYYYGKTFRRWSKNSKVHSM